MRELLDRVPARSPAPGGGSVAALVGALAAGLASMAARYAPDDWPPRSETVGRAEELRARLEPLADEDAAAYAAYLEGGDAGPTVDVPLAIAAASAEAAELAARVAAEGNPSVSGDAAVAAVLGAAAARAAARLVSANAGPEDGRVAEARAHAGRAAAAAELALAEDG